MSSHPWRNERRAITCCKDCKPPKRYPACSDHCDEYKKEKAKYIAEKQAEGEYLLNHPTLSKRDFNI